MDLKVLEKLYTDVPVKQYRWYVGIYSVFFDTCFTHIIRSDKYAIFAIFRKLRDEHTINWNRNYLYEFRSEKKQDVRRVLLSTIHSTDKFDVLKVCLYLLRNIRKNCVLDDYVLRRVPKLKNFLDNYVEPTVTDLQDKVMGMNNSEHSLRDLEALLITNRGFSKIMDYHKKTYTGDRYHLTNVDCIELQLTEDCNLKCFNCDRMCGKAPSTQMMTLQQVKKFIEESKNCEKKWARIAISGGEPTLHPDIIEIVGLVLEYRNSSLPKSSFVQIVSNGYNNAREVLKKIESMFTQEVERNTSYNTLVRNNNKRNKIVLHSPINMAPIDDETRNNNDFRNGCWVTETTGLGLTRYGYYGCSAGASIDRVFGYDIGIRSLKDVCMNRLIEQRKKLCRLCGRFNDLSIDAEHYGPNWVIEEKTSITWDKAFQLYSKNRPSLAIY
jgi:organic radical activating enzyme